MLCNSVICIVWAIISTTDSVVVIMKELLTVSFLHCREHDHPAHSALSNHGGAEGNCCESCGQCRACACVCCPAGHQDHHHIPTGAGGEHADTVGWPCEEQPGICTGVLTAQWANTQTYISSCVPSRRNVMCTIWDIFSCICYFLDESKPDLDEVSMLTAITLFLLSASSELVGVTVLQKGCLDRFRNALNSSDPWVENLKSLTEVSRSKLFV